MVDTVPYVPRWVELAGAHNVRDLGGLPAAGGRVRAGVLLRGDHLDDATTADLAVLRDVVGLRAIVDLRTTDESPAPMEWVETLGIDRLHLPLIDLSGTTRPGGLREQFAQDPAVAYQGMLAEAAPGVAQILSFVIADGHLPVLIHCAAGKDRTGITIATLLALAGVDEPGIVADYVATGERLARIRHALSQREMYKHLRTDASPPVVLPRAIEGVLDALRAHDGGVEGFMRAQGSSAVEIRRWRELLIEPS